MAHIKSGVILISILIMVVSIDCMPMKMGGLMMGSGASSSSLKELLVTSGKDTDKIIDKAVNPNYSQNKRIFLLIHC